MAYKAPLRDFQFLLNDVLDIDRYTNQPGFADVSSDLVGQILDEGAKFAEEVIAPLNRPGDQEGCHWDNGKVTAPKGWKEAYLQMVEAGWPALHADPNYGGQGMPAVVSMAFGQMTAGANAAFSMYPGLTSGAFAGLHANASDELKAIYLPKLATGEYDVVTFIHNETSTGVMNPLAEVAAVVADIATKPPSATTPSCGPAPRRSGR